MDAFDAYGDVFSLGGLSLFRQTEPLAGTNTYGVFDTFTNETAETTRTTLNFYGNLGSDGDEAIGYSVPCAIVNCKGSCASPRFDPILAPVYGNNGFGTGQ